MNIDISKLKVGNLIPVPPEPKSEREILNNWKGDHSRPLVSIICHTYNHIDFLSDALNSFLMQETDFPFEIILHDDASTDGTTELVKKYSEAYPNIINPIIQMENKYSKGFKPISITMPLARGKYIAFCEGDDYWTDPKKIQIQAKFLEKNRHVSVCGHNSITVKSNKFIATHATSQQRDFDSNSLKKGVFIQTLTAMFVNELPDIPIEQKFILNEDDFIFSQLGKLGSYKYIKEISPGVYRRHGSGVWSALDEREKKANRLNSFYWIAQYYLRTGDTELAAHFTSKLAIAALVGTDMFSVKSVYKVNKYFFRLFLKEKIPFVRTMKNKLRPK
ncbi:MAG: glycosyltransferase [Psychrobacter sp.]|nr:glycosyltransferase [Psychrobacter sp.]